MAHGNNKHKFDPTSGVNILRKGKILAVKGCNISAALTMMSETRVTGSSAHSGEGAEMAIGSDHFRRR
jgi:hypothetical protein